MNQTQPWTGERLETFVGGDTRQEHLHRYAMALEMAAGKNILDIACGEGYGVYLLSKKAAQVTGIDIDHATIEKARAKYKASNITFKQGSVLAIDAGNAVFDMVTCFETLEHTDEHDKLLAELKRVLKPGGILFISTPEKAIYSDRTGYRNPFHKKELYGHEFRNLIARYFSQHVFYGQSSLWGSLMLSGTDPRLSHFYTGDFENITVADQPVIQYWLALASDQAFTPPATGFFLSPQSVDQLRDAQTDLVKKTITYRTGHFILAPFKLIRSLFRK